MVINWKLAQEIYGVTPWFVDAKTFPAMASILANIKNGVSMEIPEEKYNAVSYFQPGSARTVDRPYGSYYNPGQLDSKEQFEAIGIININGPITKSGGMSSYGMDMVSALVNKMALDDRIKGFLIVADSGGGSSSAVEIMNDTISKVNIIKPIHALISKGGTAASAMYGIISGARQINSESEMNVVGSVGTMIQFEGRKANSQSPDGTKNIRLYATKSVKKNEEFEQAVNNDNYELLISELLDPINESFINMIVSNRPILKGTDFDNGNTKFAKDAIGTYIDGIMSFDQAVEAVMIDYKTNYEKASSKKPKPTIQTKTNTNQNNNKMDINQLRSEHPETYNAIFGAGVAAERDRVGSWMAHVGTDAEIVKNGIKSGEAISATVREELHVKAISSTNLQKIATESGANPKGATQESGAAKTAEELEVEEADNFYKNILKA